ncbi:secreted RxLR effector protein 161-like [Diospyros lotus]|uniref:secreted RxLR effector protein 161-like n=1 Tax=Diospyros lotus TaxID=55363 RepID=UPI002256DCE5|nr:secreted RxLR effector protein 161-like [Diospyros lotus]
MLVTGSNSRLIAEFKKEMEALFEMSDLGLMTYFLGMEITQSSTGIFISQRKYILDLLKKLKMKRCKSVATPLAKNGKLSKAEKGENVNLSHYRSLVGSLLYLTASRPDIMFAASVLSRYMQSPGQVHLRATKRVLSYVKGTYDSGIWYTTAENEKLQGLFDSDWAGCLNDMKNTIGYVFSTGLGVFSWVSRKQDVISQSTAEAEYMAATAAANQAIWLRKVLTDLFELNRKLLSFKSTINQPFQ